MKIDRLINILMMLINREKVTARELSNYFEVSIRTIQRDMDALTQAGIPIYADVGKNGGYQLLGNYKLDKNFLDINEANILVAFLDNLAQVVPYSEVRTISNKFSMLFPDETNEQKLVIQLNPSHNEKFMQNLITAIIYARDSFSKLSIRYIDINLQETERIIYPYTLVLMDSIWYVYAFCQLRNGFRLFKLSRIKYYDLTAEQFAPQPLPEKLPWERDLYSEREGVLVVLEIDINYLGNLPDYFNHNNCKVVDGKIIAKLIYPIDDWLYSLLTRLVPYVKIVEPAWVREEFCNRLKKALNVNKSAER